MTDLRARVPAQSLMQKTLELHPRGYFDPSGEALSWYRGALGEIAVAGVLAWLGHEWTVLHSVPVGRGDTDIDHVVIGPAGVFTINTKSHPGQDVWIAGYGLLVSGFKTNYIGAAAGEAARAEELLSAATGLTVPVTPILALVNPGKRTIKAPPEAGVLVVADWELVETIRGRQIFSHEQVARIVDAAVKPETWHANPGPDVDTRALSIQFNAIVARGHQGAVAAPVTSAPPMQTQSQPPRKTGAWTKQRSFPAWGRSPVPAPAPRSRRSSGSRRRRRRSSISDSLAQLVGIAAFVWVMYAVVLPALSK